MPKKTTPTSFYLSAATVAQLERIAAIRCPNSPLSKSQMVSILIHEEDLRTRGSVSATGDGESVNDDSES
jgi:hypothetical protein